MYLKSLKGCRLAIGLYPYFHYDASGGGGKAEVSPTEKENIQYLKFSHKTFSIPPITRKTTTFLNLRLPPGLKIEMCMDSLEGTVDHGSGNVSLDFESRFIFTIGSLFQFPDLFVKTCLKTSKVKSKYYEEEGLVLQEDGKAKLVGVAIIPVTGNNFLDRFLNLPNEALAVLKCELTQ